MEPPRSYDEFLVMEGLSEWPIRITSEMESDLFAEMGEFRSFDHIVDTIKDATKIDLTPLDHLDTRLSKFESPLYELAQKFLQPKIEEYCEDPEAWMKLSESEKRSYESRRINPLAATQLSQLKMASVDYCTIPAFSKELGLPSGLSSKHILSTVTDVITIPKKCSSCWRRYFLSMKSKRVFEDAFWLIFLKHFHKKNDDNNKLCRRLFDKLCEDFMDLFLVVSGKHKDAFFEAYPDAICQSIFLALNESLPESKKLFSEVNFKQSFVYMIHEWITGIKPRPNTFDEWDYSVLEGSMIKDDGNNPQQQKSLTQRVMEATVSMEDPSSIKMSTTGFEKRVKLMGTKNIATESQNIVGPMPLPYFPSVFHTSKIVVESHPMGPGPETVKIPFDVFSNSMLIKHYFHLHGTSEERNAKGITQNVKRTEIVKYPSKERDTYQDFLRSSKKESFDSRSRYQRIVFETESDNAKIQSKRQEICKRIEKLQKELMQLQNPLDIKGVSNYVKSMEFD